MDPITSFGEQEVLRCACCGRENPPDGRFCNRCGVALVACGPQDTAAEEDQDPVTVLQDQVRWLAERVARLELMQGPAEKRLTYPQPSYPTRGGFRPLSLLLGAGISLARGGLAGADEIWRSAPTGSTAARRLIAAAVGLVLLIVVSPVTWDLGLGALRSTLNRIPFGLGALVASALVAVLVLGRLQVPRPADALRSQGGVVLALALAAVGQGLLLGGVVPVGLAFYLSAALLALWQARRDTASLLPEETTISGLSRAQEGILLALVIAVGVFTRFYLLGAYPYGIEGDEIKWTHSVVQYSMAGERTVWPATVFISYAPLSFWYEAAFFHVFGPTLFAGRLMVALMSVAANMAFYLVARRVAGVPVALIATFLLGVSIGDMSASRMASVESQIKLWSILSPLLLLWAVDSRKPLAFILCGLAVMAGLLTYDTFHPMSAVIAAYLLVALLRGGSDRRSMMVGILLFAGAVMLAIPATLEGMRIRQGAYLGVWQAYGVGFPPSPQSLDPLLRLFASNLGDLLSSLFIRQRWGDFLLNREGPLVNGALLPLLVLGTARALARIREQHNSFLIVWIGIALFPVPVLLGAVYFRVLYPALPALYLLIALGLWWAFTRLRAASALSWRPWLCGALIGFLAVIAVFNLFIYFREVQDFPDRTQRRELVDEVVAALGPGRMVYVLYQPLRGEFIDIERPVIQFAARGKMGIGQEDRYYQQIPYLELLPRISREREQYQEVRVIAMGRQFDYGSDRIDVLDALQRSFPGTIVKTGKALTVYSIPSTALANPVATADAQARLIQPSGAASLSASRPAEFTWVIDSGNPKQVRLQVERFNDLTLPIEGESFSGSGWRAVNQFAGGFTGTGFLMDDPGAGKATYQVEIPAADKYEVWVRWYRRAADDTHVFIDADRGPTEIARSDPSTLNRWVWESAGRYDLPAGPLQLAFTKEYGRSPQMAIFLDAVIVSRDEGFDPNRRGVWDLVLDSGPMASSGGSYRWGPEPLPGRYRWRLQLLDGDRLIDATGKPGPWTPFEEFRIVP